MRITEKERKKNEKVEEKGNEMCARVLVLALRVRTCVCAGMCA